MSRCKRVSATKTIGDTAENTGRAVPTLGCCSGRRRLSSLPEQPKSIYGRGGPERLLNDTDAPTMHLLSLWPGFIANSDFISFSYARKSQVRRTIGMIPGYSVSRLLRLDAWN